MPDTVESAAVPEPATTTPPATPDSPAPAAPAPAAPASSGTPEAAPPEAPEPAETPAGGDSRTTDIVPGPGGVMTDEVGVVTGELTLRSELSGTDVTVRVQYKDADEWYAVTGGHLTLAAPADLDAVHALAVALLNRPEG